MRYPNTGALSKGSLLMSAHTFTTHERADPTSEACLTAPNRGVSVVLGYILQENEPWAEQNGPGRTDYETCQDERRNTRQRALMRTASMAHFIFMRPPKKINHERT